MPQTDIPKSRAFVHLHLPLLVSFIATLVLPVPLPFHALSLTLLAVPTYLVGSLFYHPLEPSLDHLTRFSHKHALFRVAILFTYGRIYGTPFDLQFFVADVLFNYAIEALIGEPDLKRRSEFLLHAALTVPSTVLLTLLPPDQSTLFYLVGTVDRTMYRATYVALVDDVIAALACPDTRTMKGKAILLGAQALVIFLLVSWGLSGGVERFIQSLQQASI